MIQVPLVALGIRSMPRYNEVFRELVKLELAGEQFGPYLYAKVLATYCRATIRIVTVSELSNAGPWAEQFIGKSVNDEGFMGETTYFRSYLGSRHPHFLIVIADDLPWNLKRFTIFHELAHIAAGHGFVDAERLALAGERKPQQPSIRRLADRRPFTHHSVVEEEANLRARYLILLADAGPIALEKDSLNQLY